MRVKLTTKHTVSEVKKPNTEQNSTSKETENEVKKPDYSDFGFVKIFLISIALLFISTNFSFGNGNFSFNPVLVEICDNGIDDDGDGLIDSADPDCSIGNCVDTPGQNDIFGTVYLDQNSNQVLETGEVGEAGISVNLYEDVDKDGQYSPGDVLIQSAIANSVGEYTFTVNPTFSNTYSGGILDGCSDAKDGNNKENKLDFGKDRDIGVRFEDISIPSGATITDAYLYFTAKSDKSISGNVDIFGENVSSPEDFCANKDVDLRSRTTASVSWPVSNWTSDVEYQSVDIKTVIQELVDNHGTYDNGKMSLILISNGSNNVEAKSYETNDDGTEAPRLVINFQGNSVDYIAVVDESSLPTNTELTSNPEQSIHFTGSGQAACNNDFAYYALEICDNGIDDNGNGLIDCADPSCSQGLTVAAFNDATICGMAVNISATASGGTSPYNYSWDNGLGSSPSHNVNPSTSTIYTVVVSDANGCTASDQVAITVDCTDPCSIDNGDPYLNGQVNPVELIPAGSYIINMGVQPQTINNALKPYGLVWELLDVEQVPVKWAINSNKDKDAADFTYNGTEYFGGPFIILAEYRTPAVDAIIANWESQGVVGVTTISDFSAPIARTINYSMNWTLDQKNGGIAEDYLLNAGIPTHAYNWVLPEDLDCCNDVFVMPHAEPTWATHSNLLGWNGCISEGGCRGAIWAGCKAVSEMENIYNPADPDQRLNFLMLDPISPVENPAVWSGDHDGGSMSYSYDYHDHPIMQFMGSMNGAQEGGAEQVYLPTNGWRSSTLIGIEDFAQVDIPTESPGPAAKLAFGYAFGNPNRGFVTYEAGHDVAKSSNPENIAAQRAFLNFSFMAVYEKAIKPITVVPTIMQSNQSYSLVASATGGAGAYNFSWTSDCGGTITNANTANANFIAPNVSTTTTCLIHLTVTDNCGTRTAFNTIEIVVDPTPEDCANGIDDDGDGLIDCDDPDCGGIPSPAVSGGLTICSGTSTTISAAASGGESPYTFSWSHGLGVGASKSVSPSTTTTYTVTVTGNNGCTDTDQVTITVKETPTANAGADETICRNFGTTLSGSATGGTTPYVYIWSEGLGAGESQTVSPMLNTTYSVTVTSANGCADTDAVTITVEDCDEICGNGLDDDGDGFADCDDFECGPTLDVGTDLYSCSGDDVLLIAAGSGGNGTLTYTWDNGLGFGNVKTVNPTATTIYSVTVTASGSGCTATGQITVEIIPCAEDCTNGIDDDGDGLVDCDDPDCTIVAAPVLFDDSYTTCPGMTFSQRVTYNDINLQSPAFSIAVEPANGSVSIDWTGKFTFTPFTNDCAVDGFTYQVCNTTTGCCSTAEVTINFGDNTAPVLSNIPSDITIGCDDAVPDPSVVTAFDECPGLFIDVTEESNQHYQGACASYTIVRTWTAIDLCGNEATASQNITVLDQTKPEIFQVYTLENGKRMIAGVSQRVTHDWKYVPFPITFDGTPMIFTTVVSENGSRAVKTRQRNPYSQGFELRLSSQEAHSDALQPESVAWIAIEPGTSLGAIGLEAGRWENIDENISSQTFSPYFGEIPGLITSMQSTNDAEPATVRVTTIGNGTVDLFLQEESSADPELVHGLEHVGYLAFTPGVNLLDRRGNSFGETGRVNLTNAWTTVNLEKEYTKPVIIFGGISTLDSDGVNARVRNVTGNSFEVRLQEWDYLDGNHSVESVSWMVMEGAIPGNQGYYCSGSASGLEIGNNVFAMDNCDDQIAFGYQETPTVTANGTLTSRVWMAIDDCGNTNIITRYDTCSTAALQVKAELYGALINNGGGDLMRDNLREVDFVPVEEPFSSLPAFGHVEDMTPNTSGNGGGAGGGPTSAPLPIGALSADYRTVSDGNWSSPTTWQNGSIPPIWNVNNATISIEHQVTLTSGGLDIKNNSKVWVTNGSLTLADGYFNLQGGELYCNNSTFEVTNNDLSNWTGAARMELKNSELVVGGDFNNWSGDRCLENVCMTIFGNYYNEVTDSLTNVTAVVHGNYKNTFGAYAYIASSKFNVKGGNFTNDDTSILEGEDLIIWVENGSLQNTATWSAPITQYCISTPATGLGGFLPAIEDCSGMNDYFLNTSCLLPIVPIQPQADTTLTAAQIAGPGTLEPALLTTTGNNAVVDWMLIELRDADNDTKIVDYATAVIERDGDILSEDGDPVIKFYTVPEGEYYVAIRHRNHLGMMSKDPIYLSTETSPLLDFSDPAFEVRGGTFGGRIVNGVRSMWPGEFNGDGKIIYQGPYNDVFFLFSRVVADPDNTENLANYIVEDYEVSDLNLDGKVIYQGPNNDRASVLYHAVLAHPSNNGFLANFIVQEFLP